MDVIKEVPTTPQIRRAYDFWSMFYDLVAAPLEHDARMRAVESVQAGKHDRILEVAVGTGSILAKILQGNPGHNLVCGTDISHGMLRKAQQTLVRAGFPGAILVEADGLGLPFRDGTFDVVYNSYMLDLMPIDEIPAVLAEFRRLLEPGGRIVLVNMSKQDPDKRGWFERFYRVMPSSWAAYLLGGCRPVCLRDAVLAAGFVNVTREFIQQAMPSEIVVGTSPGGL